MNSNKIIHLLLGAVILVLVVLYQQKGSSVPAGGGDLLAAIHRRTSVRSYTAQAVPRPVLEQLVRAGMAAPTAVNRQPWAFIIITDRATLVTLGDGLGRGKQMLHKAPAAIVVCGDLKKALPRMREYWVQDCSAATQNILLAAEALGLGAVWCGIHPNPEPVAFTRKVLGLPEHIIPLNIIPVGHPADSFKPKDKWKPENLRWQKWEE